MKRRYRLSLLMIAYISFISLGLPDAVGGIAWPFVRDTFSLPTAAFGLVFVSAGAGFFLSSFFSGWLLTRLGVGRLLAGSSALVCIALFGFSVAPAWPIYLLCALIGGCGSGAIDAGLNNYAAAHFSERHMNWLHACYGIGAMVGPLLFTATLLQTERWQSGYALLGAVMLAMALLFTLTRKRWQQMTAEEERPAVPLSPLDVLRHPTVRLQILIYFLYSGVEITAGQWTFTLFTEGRGFGTGISGVLVSLYWASLTAGRILFGIIVTRIRLTTLLRASLLITVFGAVLFATPIAIASAAGLLLLGAGQAPIFPGLMSQTPRRLEKAYASHAIGFQVGAAMIGGATLPAIAGLLADLFSLEIIPFYVLTAAILLTALHERLIRRSHLTPARPKSVSPR